MSPQYHTPGVYIEEVPIRQRTIVGVPTSVAAFVGVTSKGPLDTPRHLNSFAAYQRVFGRPSVRSETSLAVYQFFENGGQDAVVVRVKTASRRRDGLPNASDLIGKRGLKSGLHALEGIASVNLLVIADAARMTEKAANTVATAALSFCENWRAIYIMDVPQGDAPRGTAKAVTQWVKDNPALRHRNAALYFPRLEIANPANPNDTILVAPSGSVAGVYARVDTARGVWKAPAGLDAQLHGVEDVEHDLTTRHMDQLIRHSVNPIKRIADEQICVWGARTAERGQSDPEWKYVPVHRMAMYIKDSIDQGIQWAVFEPNDEVLWAQHRLNVSSFMYTLWRAGAFAGSQSHEAYFVRCDRETTTQQDIDIGIVNLIVGFAPLKPAEFIILEISLEL